MMLQEAKCSPQLLQTLPHLSCVFDVNLLLSMKSTECQWWTCQYWHSMANLFLTVVCLLVFTFSAPDLQVCWIFVYCQATELKLILQFIPVSQILRVGLHSACHIAYRRDSLALVHTLLGFLNSASILNKNQNDFCHTNFFKASIITKLLKL